MLLNQQGKVVNLDKKFNSVDNPSIFRQLREMKENKSGHHEPMFRLEERAKIKQ